MAETYCGKSCSECTRKEALNCPGCKNGPGQQYGCECELAQCCREKGHEMCETCGFKENCGKLRSRDYQPENRKRRYESELMQKQAKAKRAESLGKWLWPLFWIVVPSTIASIMSIEYMFRIAPVVYTIGTILSIICSITYGVILFKLSREEDRYRTAGICIIVSAIISIIVVMNPDAEQSLIISLPIAIVALIGEYNEYIAHSLILRNVNDELSEKWTTLWKWYIGCMIGMCGSIIIMLISLSLGYIVLIGAGIGSAVVGITKLVYLYRTAKSFR